MDWKNIKKKMFKLLQDIVFHTALLFNVLFGILSDDFASKACYYFCAVVILILLIIDKLDKGGNKALN